MPESVLGRYRILRRIGQGGTGAVYEAVDPSLDRRVAIKVIPLPPGGNPELFQHRFHREARLTASLYHPSIVKIYELFEQDETICIVMEYVTGRGMDGQMAETPQALWWQTFIPVLSRCASAIDYVHQAGIVHGDIKPGNIMVQNDGEPKLLDFGLARIAHQTSITQTHEIAGTLSYLAPEMLENSRASPEADQYALGVIAYQLATGRLPFTADSAGAMLYAIMSGSPTPVEKINPGIPRLASASIARALSKNPAQRFRSCQEFLDQLQLMPKGGGEGIWTMVESVWDKVLGKSASSPAASGPAAAPKAQPRSPSEQTRILRRPVDSRLEPQELAKRQADELIERASDESFEPVMVLEGKWLPGIEGADATLLAFREAARYLVAAANASSPHNAVEHLTRAESVLVAAGNQLLKSQQPAAAEMPRALEVWRNHTRNKLAEARELVKRQLPNPYRAGQPLRPDQGRVLFRGREPIVRQIESILADANQSGSIALLGPRRCGKTSVLQMLPELLPDCICVFFDLQDNPVDSTPAFFQALERQAQEQSRRDRRVELPPLRDGGSFASATQWFQELDNLPGDFRILLCLDEFERLEDLFPGNRQDLLRLMGLFRATIQHRRRVRLLVSGVAPFDELGQLWNDHFINVREIRVGHLDRATAVDLLVRPLSDFPPDAVPEDVANRVFERTGGQPYLLQLYGALLIGLLNEQKRRQATVADIGQIEEEAMSQGAYYFRHTYESAPEESREALKDLAAGHRTEMSTAVQRWLNRRGLINNEKQLTIPVLGTFIREELGL